MSAASFTRDNSRRCVEPQGETGAELWEKHRLVTGGIYCRTRHPMYTAILLYCLGPALAVPNWVAGPSYLITFLILLVLRLRAEEAMMLEQFRDEYAAYMTRTKRLVPGV